MDVTNEGFKFAVDARRAVMGITQEELARRIGVKRTQMIGRIEYVDKKGSLQLLYLMADALGIPATVLLTEAEDGTLEVAKRARAAKRKAKK